MSSKGIGEPPNMLANCVGFAIIDAIEAKRKKRRRKKLSHFEFPLTPNKIIHYLTHLLFEFNFHLYIKVSKYCT